VRWNHLTAEQVMRTAAANAGTAFGSMPALNKKLTDSQQTLWAR
jgi:hypothetical protein